MKERFKELRDEAFRLTEWEDLDYDAILEKFGELIVEECRYVMDCNKGSDQHTEWNRALTETSTKIKEHFGVE